MILLWSLKSSCMHILLFSMEERKSYWFGMTRERVNVDRNIIGANYPFYCVFVWLHVFVAVSPRSSSVQRDFMCFSLYISIMSCMLLTAELMMKLFPVCARQRGRTEKTRRLFPAHRDKGATFRFCFGGQVLVPHQTLEFSKHTCNMVDILYI